MVFDVEEPNFCQEKEMYSFIPEAQLLLNEIFDFPHWNSFKKELPIAPDTYRKMLNGDEVSERSKNKMIKFFLAETNQAPEVVTKYLEKGGYLPQGQLKGFIDGVRFSSSAPKESFFLDQMEKMLNLDVHIGHLCNEENDELNRHEIFWESDLAKRLCTPMGLRNIPSKEQHREIKALGTLSLILYFIAAYEVAIKEKYTVDRNKRNALVDEVLPEISDGSMNWPIKRVTQRWQKEFDIASVEKLSWFLPSGYDMDIDSKKRKLEFWRSGEKHPDIDYESTLLWLEGFCRDSSRVNEEYIRFHMATILQRLAKTVYPELFPPKINSNVIEFRGVSTQQRMESVVKLFQMYKQHYQSNLTDFQNSRNPS